MAINPLRIDPTRTTTLRRRYTAEMSRRFRRLKKKINDLLIEEDAFGLRPATKNPFTGNAEDYASTQLDLSAGLAQSVRELSYRISDVHLHAKGREDKPHITVRYGLHSKDAEDVRPIVERFSPIVVELGRTSHFEAEEFDVVKVDVKSPALVALHRALGAVPHTDTHATYSPHLTLAYVQKGYGKLYDGWERLAGVRATFDSVTFSSKDRDKVYIPLLGELLTTNTRWRFLSTPQQLEAFVVWLQAQIASDILEKVGDRQDQLWFQRYIEEGYKVGLARVFADVKKPFAQGGRFEFYIGGRDQFLRDSFFRPVAIERVKLLAARSFNDLKGITEAMSQQISRELVDGMIQGLGPREVARNINKRVDKIGRTRALALARTETIRAHNEGQLDAFEALGVEEIGVAVEWSTAKDFKVCPECRPLQGVVFKVAESRGMIPRHPNCLISPKVPIYTADGWKPIGKVKVGDLVLTRQGRFRKVLQTHKNLGDRETVVEFRIGFGGTQHKITITGLHPVLVNNHWTAAEDIKPGDMVRWMSSQCQGCRKVLPYGLKYCGVGCQWANEKHRKNISKKNSLANLRQYASGERNGKEATKAAHARVRELIALGQFDHPRLSGDANPTKRPEVRKKISEGKMGDKNPMRIHREIGRANGKALAEYLRKNPDKHPNRLMARKGFKSYIERSMERAFEAIGLTPEFQYPIDSLWVDFAFPELKVAVECDGEYWHKDKLKEARRDKRLESLGWTVLHFTGKQIKKNAAECAYKVNRVLNNHSGNYRFANFEVVEVLHRLSGKITMYNLSVEEDESYIAKGCVVHNCRCAWIPANVGESTKGQKRSQGSIKKAIDDSIRAELPKKTKRSLAEQKRRTKWAGADKRIAKKRPKSIL